MSIFSPIDPRRFESDDDLLDELKNRSVRHLKESIRRRRSDLNMTQADLATVANMKQPAISRAESPKYLSMNLDTLHTIAAAMDCVVVLELKTRSEVLREISEAENDEK